MSSPIQRGSSWQAKVRRKLPNGEVFNKTGTFNSKREAQDWIDVQNGLVATGERPISRKREAETSLSMLLDRYETEKVNSLKPHPMAQRRSHVARYRRLPWAAYPLVNLSSRLIVEWRQEMLLEEGLSGSTVRTHMTTLSGVFKMAIGEWHYTITNPLAGVQLPDANPARSAYLAEREEKILLRACDQGPPQLPWAVRIALKTAMRASEIRRLERHHIHLDLGFVHLPETKNGLPRDVPLVLPGAIEVMAEALAALPVRADGYLFGDPEKLGSEGGYTADMLSSSFATAVDRAAEADEQFKSLNADLTFHDLRHVATTALAPLHRDAMDLSKTTGHLTLSVLARYYNEPINKRVERLRDNAREEAVREQRRVAHEQQEQITTRVDRLRRSALRQEEAEHEQKRPRRLRYIAAKRVTPRVGVRRNSG